MFKTQWNLQVWKDSCGFLWGPCAHSSQKCNIISVKVVLTCSHLLLRSSLKGTSSGSLQTPEFRVGIYFLLHGQSLDSCWTLHSAITKGCSPSLLCLWVWNSWGLGKGNTLISPDEGQFCFLDNAPANWKSLEKILKTQESVKKITLFWKGKKIQKR